MIHNLRRTNICNLNQTAVRTHVPVLLTGVDGAGCKHMNASAYVLSWNLF